MSHTFTRQEVVTAAQAALDNWDFEVYEDEAKATGARQNLEDIVEGRDDVGADPDYPATWKSDDINDWLYEYTNVTGWNQ